MRGHFRPAGSRSLATVLLVLALAAAFGIVVPTGARSAASPSAAPAPGTSLSRVVEPGAATGASAALPAHGAAALVHADSVAVNPLSIYSSEPAPMGIADFGVGTGGTPYRYNSTEFLGNFSWNNLTFRGASKVPASQTSITLQLNVVLEFEVGATNYSYWVQDVAFLNTTTLVVQFEDNVWNFSSAQECLGSSAVSGNGSVFSLESGSCTGYYAYGAVFQAGNGRTMGRPGTFSLLVRSYRAGDDAPEVAFEYWDGATTDFVTYDNVQWPWAAAASTADANFVVDGSALSPAGLFYDAELVEVGPGDASSSEAFAPTNSSTGLFFWNGHNFQAPRSAWNFGSDTAETSTNITSSWVPAESVRHGGTMALDQQNGSGAGASLGLAYDQSSAGALNVSASGIASGTVTVGSTSWAFEGDEANLTLAPGTYGVWVNTSTSATSLGDCTVNAGATTFAAVSTGCSATVSEPAATPTSVDLGQNVSFTTSVQDAGSGTLTYSWNVTPAGLGCAASTGLELNCSPTLAGTYSLSVTLHDTKGSIVSPTLRFVVHPDPTVTLAGGTDLDVGQTTTITATPSGGTGVFTYAWTGLPDGCLAGSSASFGCTPGTAGSYQVEVNATDSAGVSTQASLGVTVYSRPSTPTVTVSPSTVLQGDAVTIEVSVGGGRAPYSYAYETYPPGCVVANAPELNCTPSGPGTFTITVEVVDTNGVVVNGTAQLTVTPKFLGLPATEGYELLALGVVAVIAVAVALAVARGRRRPPGSPAVASAVAPRSPGPGPASAPPTVGFCPSCGSSTQPGSLYCGGCGGPLPGPGGSAAFPPPR